MSKHDSENEAHKIEQSLRALLFCSEPRPGQDLQGHPLADILGDVGLRIFQYAKGLESGKAQLLADILSGVACCMAGMPRGVPQMDCQQYSTELLHQLRTTVADHHNGESPLEDDPDIDPLTLIAVIITVLLVALAGSYLPALGATRVDPLSALRYE